MKADKTTVEAIDGRVGANETAITALQGADTQINAAIDLKADKTTVEAIDGRVTANEGVITALPNNYQAKAGEGLSIAQNGGWAVPTMPDACKSENVECALVAVAGGAPKWQIIR